MSGSNRNAKRSKKGLFPLDNCVVALIDFQPQMLFDVSKFESSGDRQQCSGAGEGSQSIRCTGRPVYCRNRHPSPPKMFVVPHRGRDQRQPRCFVLFAALNVLKLIPRVTS